MLRVLHRILPASEARSLVALTGWISAAAILQGIALGLTGITIASLLGSGVGGSMGWLLALVGSGVAFVIVQWVAQMHAFRTGSETARALHHRLGTHVAGLPLGWFTPPRQAELIDTATTGVPQLMSYPALLLRPALTALLTPVAAAATLGFLDWRYSIAVLAATVVAWYASRLSQNLAHTVDTRRHQVSTEAANRILEYATRQPVIRTDGRPDDDDDLHRALRDAARESRRSTATVLPGLLLFSLTLNALFAVLIAVGVLWVTDATLTVPVFIGLLVTTARLTAVAAAGAELAAGLRMQHGALNRISAILDTPPLPVLDHPAAVETPGGPDLVKIESLSFRYNDTPVIDDVTFTLPRRGLTALVGPSGSGKTTITRLLARFWDPGSGRVLFNGTDLRSIDPDLLYEQIAMVFQDDYLFDATIGENILVGRQTATDAEFTRAIGSAGLDSTIAEFPDGLDTAVRPAGTRLSGGQRQRVSIARALCKAAPLTIMDEATSALDPENTRLISHAARTLAQTGSVLVIAHNLDTIRHADQILVLDGGRIIQRGTHNKLVEQDGRYRALLAAQPGH